MNPDNNSNGAVPNPQQPLQPSGGATPPAQQPQQQNPVQSPQPAMQQPQAPVSAALPPQPVVSQAPVPQTQAPQPLQPQQPMMASQQPMIMPAKRGMNIKKIAMVVVGLLVATVAAVFIVTLLGSGGESVSAANLVEESVDGMKFKRPGEWKEAVSSDADVAYTLEGGDIENASEGMIVLVDSLGADFSTLTDEQKSTLSSTLEENFSNPGALEGGQCQKVDNISFRQVNKSGYNISYVISATCVELADREGSAILKMALGITGSNMHSIAVIATSDTWDNSGEALDAIIDSIEPIQ